MEQQQPSFPVFAFLPVCDLGFKFIVNCYWSLVTSRESLNEHSKVNNFYRDKVAELFEWIARNDTYLSADLQFYLPNVTPEMSPWWKLFVLDVKNENERKNMQLRIYNESLRDLLVADDEKVLKNGANIQLLHPNKLNMSENDLMYYDFKKLSIFDLLECLKLNNEAILDWIETRPNEWWESFFKHLNKSMLTSTNEIR